MKKRILRIAVSPKEKLDQFFHSLAYTYIRFPDFADISDQAGIRWFDLPRDIVGVDVVQTFLTYMGEMPREKAYKKIQDDKLRLIETSMLDLQTIDWNVSILAHDFQTHIKAFEYSDLSNRLSADPYSGQAILEEFDPTTGCGIGYVSASDLLPIAFAEHMERVKQKEVITRIPTFEMLSDMIGGFNPGRVVMITGSTGFGKTNLGLSLGVSAATKMVVGYVNMEMSYDDMAKRMIVISSGYSYSDFFAGKVPEKSVADLCRAIKDRFYMTSGRSLSMISIEAWIRGRCREGMKILMIDYDQKIDLVMDRHTPEWKSIQRAIIRIEDLAKELKFCAVVFAQVNRDGDISSSHRAQFTAHTVLSFEDLPEDGPAIVAKKNRHGEKNAALLVNYDKNTSRISERRVITLVPELKKKTRTIPRVTTTHHWADKDQ